MLNNGNHSGNGNGNGGKLGAISKELGGFTIAELASEGVWLGVAAMTTLLPEKVIETASKVVGHTIVEPVLEPLEKIMMKVCKLDECKLDCTQSREKRSENLGRAVVIFTPALVAALGVKLGIRAYTVYKGHPNKGVPLSFKEVFKGIRKEMFTPQANMITFADEGTLIGAMYVMNNQLAPYSDDIIRTTTSLAQKILGVPEKRAHEFASTVVIWGIPNAIGMLGATTAIIGKHLYDWPKGLIGKMFGRKPGDYLPPHHG